MADAQPLVALADDLSGAAEAAAALGAGTPVLLDGGGAGGRVDSVAGSLTGEVLGGVAAGSCAQGLQPPAGGAVRGDGADGSLPPQPKDRGGAARGEGAGAAGGAASRTVAGTAGTAGAVVVNLGSRSLPADQAAARTRATMAALGPLRPRMKKIDSLLRGNIAAELREVRDSWPGVTVVVATALPSMGRSSLGGVVLVEGRPLHETGTWAVEQRPVPRSVAEALGATGALVVGADTLRSGGLPGLIDRHRGGVLVVDGEDAADLEAVVAGAAQAGGDVLLVGASALCEALARTLPAAAHDQPVDGRHSLCVVGTASPQARQQRALLVERTDTETVGLTPSQLVATDAQQRSGLARRIRQALSERDVVLAIEPDGSSAPGTLMTRYLAEIAVAALGDEDHALAGPASPVASEGPASPCSSAAPGGLGPGSAQAGPAAVSFPAGSGPVAAGADPVLAVADGPAGTGPVAVSVPASLGPAAGPSVPAPLILTGGETAEAVLSELGVRCLTVLRQAHPGAVVSQTDRGVLVATRPGSFGGPDSLLLMRRCLSQAASAATSRPVPQYPSPPGPQPSARSGPYPDPPSSPEQAPPH